MPTTISNKELDDFPEEIKIWGNQALSKIVSPEKRAEATIVLKKEINTLWHECSKENTEEKIEYVLSSLGDADLRAEKLKKTYCLEDNPKTDKVIGIISLILAGICSIYPLMFFFAYDNPTPNDMSIYAGYITGKGVFSAILCSTFFFLFGIWLLIISKKKDRGN